MPLVLLLDTLDAASGPYTVESYDFPDAVLSADATARQGAGIESEDFEPAPWSVTWICRDTDTATAQESLAVLTRALRHGTRLTFSEPKDSTTGYTFLKTVQSQGSDCYGTWLRATFTGTRYPAWHGDTADVVFDGAVTSKTVALPAAVDIESVPAGELRSALSLRALPSVASDFVAVGIKSAPAAGFAPIQDYAAATLSTTGTFATVGTPDTLSIAAMRGDYLPIVRVKTNAATAANTDWRAVSTLPADVGPAYQASGDTYPQAVKDTFEHLSLGKLRIPAQGVADESFYGAWEERVGQSSQTGTSKTLSQSSYKSVAQSFTVSSKIRHRGFEVKSDILTLDDLPAGPWLACLSDGTNLLTSRVGMTHQGGGIWRATWEQDGVVLSAGTYYLHVDIPEPYDIYARDWSLYRDTSAPYSGGTGYVSVGVTSDPIGTLTAGDGVDSSVDWWFRSYEQVASPQTAKVEIESRCAESSKTSTLDTLTMLPLDEGAAVATAAFLAGEGVYLDSAHYDPQRFAAYYADANDIGYTVDTDWYGTRFGLAPGTTSQLVVEAGTDNATGNVTLSGTYTERYIHRIRG